MAKVLVRRADGRTVYWLWCPACDDAVMIDEGWGWNGDVERPTFTPSLLTRFTMQGSERVCHSFVVDGVWQYLGDCTHDKVGQHVPMVDFPDGLA
jgi:hypothetical protein